ncbi:MAG: 50S ribosomal protein L25, partial [Candidatus Cloacimonetes bacterium]|nr:50S ribosomal protein L25 [Candidatus Cloacimonadota bacterium]
MIFTIEAQKRTNTKHSELTALRQQGLIPAVIYGKD